MDHLDYLNVKTIVKKKCEKKKQNRKTNKLIKCFFSSLLHFFFPFLHTDNFFPLYSYPKTNLMANLSKSFKGTSETEKPTIMTNLFILYLWSVSNNRNVIGCQPPGSTLVCIHRKRIDFY